MGPAMEHSAPRGLDRGIRWLWGWSSLVVSVAALFAILLAIWSAEVVTGNFRENQNRLMENEGRSVAVEISRFVHERDRMVEVFAEQNGDLLTRFLESDEDPVLHAELKGLIERYFPNYFAFTLRDADARFVPDDFEEFVGPVCRNDIAGFWEGRKRRGEGGGGLYHPFIHPQSGNYHFDTMAVWKTAKGDDAVLFVSFHPTLLAQIISSFELPGHDVFLVRQDQRDLIEAAAGGTRDRLGREIRLSPQEMARVAFSIPVPHTRWVAQVLPEAGFIEGQTEQVHRQAGIVILGILVFWGGALWLMGRIRRQREQAYREVRDLNETLEQRVAERTAQVAKLSRAVEQSPAMIVITDTDGVIQYVNPRFAVITGFSQDEAIGQTPKLVNSGENPRSVYDDLWASISSGHDWSGQLLNRRRDGSTFWVLASISPLKSDDGEVTHFVAVEEDITERVRMEGDLVQAKEEAEFANRSKTEFLANMSHELRTPLNAIIGFSDIMVAESFGPIGGEHYAEYSRDINASGKHLLDLINDLLDVARIESGDMPLAEQRVDLAQVGDSCLRMIRDRAEKAGLAVVSEIADHLPPVQADARKIKQVLLNLLGNAVKFTEKGSIRLFMDLDPDGFVAIRIADTGIGIAPEDIKTVLTSFGQADGSLARRFEGAGLGLPLSRHLVELHGGTLTLDSTPGVGTTVIVRLPPERVLRDA